MLNGQDIFKRKNSHEAPKYITTVTSEDIAFEFCLKHRGEGYYYIECLLCESVSELEACADHREGD